MGRFLFIVVLVVMLFAGCNEEVIPKPKGYFHIALPEKKYVHFEAACPFECDISASTKIALKDSINCFYNLEYPKWKATLYLTYLPIKNDLKELIDEEHRRKEKHIQLASSIEDSAFVFSDRHVSATVFNINGTKTATPLQFFITDSTHHFFRGALYFYHSPNNDSIAPIISFIKDDVRKMIATFKWK
ncbi:MAG: gliding motility lipoprotein GldD [Bacteroidetes bacterium]|nr:gliding motility lipoprotein GldD [Bacteroidota bacterium]